MFISVDGKMGSHKEKELILLLMVISLLVNFGLVKRMDKAPIFLVLRQNTRAIFMWVS